MIPKHIHAHNRLVEVGVRALRDIVVEVLLVAKHVHALKDKLEQRFQVFRTGTRDEDVRIPVSECSSDGKTQSGRFSATTTRSKCHSRRQSLLSDGVDEGKDSLGLVDRLREFDEVTNGFGVSKTVLQVLELGLFLALPPGLFNGLDVFATRDRQYVELIVENKTVVARS